MEVLTKYGAFPEKYSDYVPDNVEHPNTQFGTHVLFSTLRFHTDNIILITSRFSFQFGRTPVYYTKIQTDFNHRKLLKDFGVEVNEDEDPINDKGTYN